MHSACFDGPVPAASRALIAQHEVAAPDLMRIETLSVLRRRSLSGHLTSEGAEAALADLLELAVRVFPNTLLLERNWELRDNISTYDACYVALAEALRCPLATIDGRLANTPGARCKFILIEPVEA